MVNNKPKTMQDFLAKAKLPQQSVPICLRADVNAEIAELERRIAQLQADDSTDQRLTDTGDEASDLAKRIRELEAEAADYTIPLRLTAVSRRRWQKGLNDNTTKKDDGTEDLDLSALWEDLFADSVVSPPMTEVERVEFLTGLTEGQWEQIGKAIWELNREGASVPKSLRASMALRTRSETPGPDGQ